MKFLNLVATPRLDRWSFLLAGLDNQQLLKNLGLAFLVHVASKEITLWIMNFIGGLLSAYKGEVGL